MARVKGLSFIVIALIGLASAFSIPVHASGIVYVNPNATPVQSPGSFFSVQVNVANIDPFNGWDIQVVSDPGLINATSLSIAGNILAANYSATVYELVNCVNGGGFGCQSTDGPGVVHSAALIYSPSPQQGSSSGFLFNITYKVISSARTFSPLELQNFQIASNGNSVSVVPQDGQYGNAPVQNFALTPPASNVRLVQGSSSNITLTVSSLGGFSGLVMLTNTSSTRGLSIRLNATSFPLAAGQQVRITVTVAAHNSTSAIGYTITVEGKSGFLFHRSTISAIVSTRADFILVVTPSLLKIHAGNSGSSIITVDTQSGFSGSIRLFMAVPPVSGLVATLGSTNLTISPGMPASTVFAVRTPPSNLPFVYLINITASSQSSTHMPFTIIVRSPSPDFAFQISGSGFAVQAGQSRTFTLNMSSVDYFKGQVFLLATSFSGMKEAFTRPSVALDFGNSSTSLMTISTDPYLAPGNHIVNMTALGTTFLGVSINHTITTTITVISVPVAKTILGLQPFSYFGIVGVIWIAVIGAAIREIRRPKPKRFLS